MGITFNAFSVGHLRSICGAPLERPDYAAMLQQANVTREQALQLLGVIGRYDPASVPKPVELNLDQAVIAARLLSVSSYCGTESSIRDYMAVIDGLAYRRG